MKTKASSICLVTNTHISYNPRLVKEADALAEAGYEIRVVAMTKEHAKIKLDDNLVKARSWTLECIDVRRTAMTRPRLRWFIASLRQFMFQKVGWLRRMPGGVDKAYSRYVEELTRLASRAPADLFIAHNLPTLPAAARAAARHDAKLGFDAEDFHCGEYSDGDASLMRQCTEQIEASYMPSCDYVTAASKGIAQAYAEALPIKQPTTILNVFPVAEPDRHTPDEALEREKKQGAISLYWYSQVIGPERGLQDALGALTKLHQRVHLSMRGAWAKGFEAEFMQTVIELGLSHRVHILPPVPPEQLIERAARHDIGLALEQADTRNRDLCVTNKLLVYLLAGLPVVATDTVGQRDICKNLTSATRLCPIGNAGALAEAVQSFVQSDICLGEAKQAARHAGENQYNWDTEKEKLLSVVEIVLNSEKSRS